MAIRLSNVICPVNKKVHKWTFPSRTPSLVAIPIAEIDIHYLQILNTHHMYLNTER